MLVKNNEPDVLRRNNVKVVGDSDRVMLFAHGFGCNQSMWDRVAPAFSDSYKQVMFDYVGSGQSDIRAFDPIRYSSLAGYVQDLLDVCDTLGLQSGVTFVGHSVSCNVGILASIARPDLFERLILVGPNPCFLNDPPDYFGGFERSDLEDLLDLMEQNYIGWANYLAPVISAESESGALTAELTDSFCSTDPLTAKVFARTTFFSDNRADLPKVSRPCLVIQHYEDTLAPVCVGEYVHRHIKGSTLKILDVQGHCAHMSAPELVIDAIREYIGKSN